MQSVNIFGQLAASANAPLQLRSTSNGTPVCNFVVFVKNPPYRDQSGNTVRPPDTPVYCVVFGGQATALAQYMATGGQVAVEGKITNNVDTDQRYTNANGEIYSARKMVVKATNITFASNNRAAGQAQAPTQTQQPAPAVELPVATTHQPPAVN